MLHGADGFVALTDAAVPVDRADRIRDIDVIRGVALFGVVWMNLADTTARLMPAAVKAALPTAAADRVMAFLGDWVISGKAQCQFGVLFGVGFALFTERVARRRADAGQVYARRLTFLLALGLLHFFLLWWGDILHDYAAVGFLLLLTPRLSDRALIGLALALLLCSGPAVQLWSTYLAGDEGAAHHAQLALLHTALWRALTGGHYVSLIHCTAWRADLTYANPRVLAYLGMLAGQFLLGAWIFRKGWLQDTAGHIDLFRRLAATALPAGLLAALVAPIIEALGVTWHGATGALLNVITNTATLSLALGYASLLVLACRHWTNAALVTGLAAFGRMALTNYVAQSIFILFVFDGFGLGLMRSSGAAVDVLLALVFAASQIAISVWWLGVFRFGPLEWLWRSATYGQWQRLRQIDSAPA